MTDNELTSAQKKFIAQISIWIDRDSIGKKFDLIWEDDRKCVRQGSNEISINLESSEMFQLARLGYFVLFLSSTPKAIIFKEPILPREADEKHPDGLPILASKSNEPVEPSPSGVMHEDLLQLRIWLGASLAFAVIAVFLLWTTVNALLAGRIPTTVGSGIITLVTTIAAAVFFRNYYKAHDWLKESQREASSQKEETK